VDLSLSGVTPASVQWTLGYSTVDFGTATVTAGPAATAASKQISCNTSAGSAMCILWGLNNSTIASGVVATVTLPLSYTSDSSSPLQLTGAAAADPTGVVLATSTTGGTVTIEPGLTGFTCNPVSIAPPASSTCTLTLTAPAPAAGAAVAVTANPASAVTLSSPVTVPQASLSTTFNVPAGVVAASTPVMLTASYLSVNQGFGITVTPPATPQISSLSPTSATVGTAVTITGTNFGATQGSSTVTFNGTAATPTSWSATSIVVPVPAAATTGNVVVTVNTVASNGVPFTVLPTPAISSLSPSSGVVGTAVTIAGTNFGASQGSSTLAFNGTAAAPTSWSATSIVAPVPAGASTGSVVVTVGGVASNGVVFTVGSTPSITGLNPNSAAAGTAVTIAGANFGASQGSSTITFNGTAATPTSWSATSIVAPVPAGASSGNVVVTVASVASNGMAFTVVPTPALSSLSPASGAVGASVTITGTNFGASQGTSTVKFNGTAATPTGWSATSITAPVPAGATSGNVVVTVGGAASNGLAFTVLTTPNISSLSPASATVGTAVTIAGTNFGTSQGTSTVTFNGTAATPTSWSATSIVAPVPVGATSGNVIVKVSGVASNGAAFTVQATVPNISSLSPNSGPVGTAVTITGTNFGTTLGGSTVKFNGTTATPTSWSATSIVVPVPAGASSGNVVVTVNGTASNGVTFTVSSPTPAISSLSPASGAVGTAVTINGTNFGAAQGSSTVTFNGTAATPTSWSATSIVAPVPAGATSGDVVVTVNGAASNGVAFTVLKNTTLSSISVNPSIIVGGQGAMGTVTLSAPAGVGVSVAISAQGPNGVISVPNYVKVPYGAKSATFPVGTRNVTKVTSITVVASDAGVTKKTTAKVQPAP